MRPFEPNPLTNIDNIARGFNGELYIQKKIKRLKLKDNGEPLLDATGKKQYTEKMENLYLAMVNEWGVQVNVNNTDYQAASQPLVMSVFQGYSMTLRLVEAVIRDAALLEEFLNDLSPVNNGISRQTYFTFIGKVIQPGLNIERTDGTYVLRNCTPDGSIDIVNVRPGDILIRNWNFRVNSPMKDWNPISPSS